MCRAVSVLLFRFPDIQEDIAEAEQNADPLISKIRKVCIDYMRLYAQLSG